jgi:hypothetical protein
MNDAVWTLGAEADVPSLDECKDYMGRRYRRLLL